MIQNAGYGIYIVFTKRVIAWEYHAITLFREVWGAVYRDMGIVIGLIPEGHPKDDNK